jgi:copper(I)-binding protein
MKPLTAAAAFLALVAALPAVATAAEADDVTVVAPVVRLAPPGAMATGAFMILRNGSDKDVKLVKAASPAAKLTQLHTHLNEGGIMKMRPVAAIDIKAKSETLLKPGGLHVMLIDLTQPMKEGDKVAITLGFEDGSSKQIEAPVVKPMDQPAMPMDHMDHMDHMAPQK